MRHAFCIMAYNDYNQLAKMIELLDSEKSDFYIHINALADMPSMERFYNIVKKSNIYFTKRIPIIRGQDGVLRAKLQLFEEETEKGKYDYYHILSGQDFPIKSFEELDCFLEENVLSNDSKGMRTNYIDARMMPDRKGLERVTHFNFLIPYWRHPNKLVRGAVRGINLISHLIQRLFRVNRLHLRAEDIYYGAFCYSVTDEFVTALLENKKWILEHYTKHSFAPDEEAVQTFFANSEFRDTTYKSQMGMMDDRTPHVNLRLADYVRGNGASPYVFRHADKEELLNSSDFFARKFTESIDTEIVDELYTLLKKQ